MRTPLPVDAVLPELCAALRAHPCALLRAETGAGKTTRVPGALLDAGHAGDGQVVVLEPRRLAARAAARRVAAERGCAVGDEVGWHVRLDRRAGPRTRILFCTEGVFLRRAVADPLLEGVACVVLDEQHERTLDGDLALALARRAQREVRDDLRLIAMSATLDPAPLALFLGDAPLVESQGRRFPVEVRHRPGRREVPLETQVAAAVQEALDAIAGDVLVFLPGRAEISRTERALEGLARARGLALVELFGDLPPERQDAALRAGGRRRIVLATNVAESSVTVEGVAAVVDAGLVRRMRHDPAVGLDRLVLGRVSRSSAEQRAGRAGRLGPGLCLRLWSEVEDRALPAAEEPEVRRADLAGAALALRAAGEVDPEEFPWFEAPRHEALARAEELLARLGAVGPTGLSARGRALARLPVHPRLGALLLEGARRGVAREAALAAALLSDRDPFRRGGRAREAEHHSGSDVMDRVRALASFEAGGATRSAAGEASPGAARAVLAMARQLERLAARAERGAQDLSGDAEDALGRALLAGWPDRVARRRAPGDDRGRMVGGRGVRLDAASAVREPELFLCVDVEGSGADARVRLASAVEREWLDAGRLCVEEVVEWDPSAGRAVALRRTLYEDLPLSEVELGTTDTDSLERALATAAAADLARALPLEDPAVAAFRTRVAFLREWAPELALPALDDAALRALLPALCAGRRSLSELRKAPLLDHLRGALGYDQLAALEREAPERLAVPSGSQLRITYEPDRPPVLAARIQELFGLAETPRLAFGRAPVLLHLLAPNGRPQQVTDDLRSFWGGAYHLVRKELRARYPRHAWPEDPWTARAERRPRRR